VETAAGNVNAIQREQENVSRVVVSLGARVTQLQQEIESLLRKQQETPTRWRPRADSSMSRCASCTS